MGCNCNGNNDYELSLDSTSGSESTTPEYTIILDGTGTNGFSPAVNFINQTANSFQIQVQDIEGIKTSGVIPLINSIGNGTITITQGGETKGTFTTNQSGNTTIELDAGGGSITNPLEISQEVNNQTRTLEIGLNSSTGALYSQYKIVEAGSSIVRPLPLFSNTGIVTNGGLLQQSTISDGFTYNSLSVAIDDITIKINQDGELYAVGGSGAVDSVNGYTGDVVLTASDVGALPDTTIIPTKTSELINDSNFATVSQIPTVNNPTITFTQGGTTKGTITLNQSSNQTINFDAGGGGSSYTAGTGIDITNDVISVDNTVAMKTDIPSLTGYATEQWVSNQGYLTSISSTDIINGLGYTPYNASNPNNYTSNIGTVTSVNGNEPDTNGNVTLSIPTITVDQTYDSTSTNAQSGVAINGAKFIRNLTLGTGSVNIETGAVRTNNYAITIGGSASSSNQGVAIGYNALGNNGVAIGYNAKNTVSNAIQIGTGTNSTANSLQVGSYQLLNTSTGLIPDARISSNIARTSDVADINLSNITNTGKSLISDIALPSNSYVDLTAGESGTLYTMPSAGWLCIGFQHPYNNDWVNYGVDILDSTGQQFIWNIQGTRALNNQTDGVVVPVARNQKVRIFQNGYTINRLRFIYAQGSESEAS